MKRTLILAVALFGMMATAWAQDSLGDYARKQRDQQQPTSPNSHVWTNDDLGSSSAAADSKPAASDGKSATAAKKDDAKDAAALDPAERTKQENEWKKKVADQKSKIAGLEHDMEIAEREYKLRTISWYTTTSKALLDQKNWSDQQKKYEDEKAANQKKLDDAKAELEKMRDDIRKAGFSSSLGE